MPKISVIVPVYNVESYLCQCIDSILAQTYTDFELLLVNDGSTDDSGVICDKYAQYDNRVRVFHKTNGGLSSARNLGIDNIHSEWTIFVDSDDYWLSPTVLNDLMEGATKFNADIVRGELCYVDQKGTYLWDNKCKSKDKYGNLLMSNASFLNNVVGGKWWVWLSLYRSTILQKFDVTQRFQEDIDFNIRLFTKELRCLYLPIIFYAYRIRNGSLVNNLKQSNLYFSFRLCNTFREYSDRCQDNEVASIYRYNSIMMYYWTLKTLSEFFYSHREQIIKKYNLKKIQSEVALLAKWKVFKYPLFVFLKPNLGCMLLHKYIKFKKIVYLLKSIVIR